MGKDEPRLGFILAELLEYSLGYAEFISGERPGKGFDKTVAKMRLLQKRIAEATMPFLSQDQTVTFQNEFLPILLYWNSDITKQVIAFYNAHAEIGRLTASGKVNVEYNPLKAIIHDRGRFMQSVSIFADALERVNKNISGEPDIYAVFYALISSTEVVESALYKPFKKLLKDTRLDSKYDIDSIFSVQKKMLNNRGDYQTDSRMIRNALAHLDYDLTMHDHSFDITLREDTYNQEINFNHTEFFKFVQDHKLLMQSFFAIISCMATFSTMRKRFVIDP